MGEKVLEGRPAAAGCWRGHPKVVTPVETGLIKNKHERFAADSAMNQRTDGSGNKETSHAPFGAQRNSSSSRKTGEIKPSCFQTNKC